MALSKRMKRGVADSDSSPLRRSQRQVIKVDLGYTDAYYTHTSDHPSAADMKFLHWLAEDAGKAGASDRALLNWWVKACSGVDVSAMAENTKKRFKQRLGVSLEQCARECSRWHRLAEKDEDDYRFAWSKDEKDRPLMNIIEPSIY
jgi:hypothetical protein